MSIEFSPSYGDEIIRTFVGYANARIGKPRFDMLTFELNGDEVELMGRKTGHVWASVGFADIIGVRYAGLFDMGWMNDVREYELRKYYNTMKRGCDFCRKQKTCFQPSKKKGYRKIDFPAETVRGELAGEIYESYLKYPQGACGITFPKWKYHLCLSGCDEFEPKEE